MGSLVLGEPVAVLLRELAAHTGGAEPVHDGLLGFRVAIPPGLGGALRRALLRATAVELCKAAEEVRDSFLRLDQHELEGAAVLRVARAVTRTARADGLSGRSLQERALLLGTVSSVPGSSPPPRPGP